MRKILSKQEHAKKQKRNQAILGIGLLVIMMLSIIGYGFIGRPDEDSSIKKVIFNGLEFSNINGFWAAQINEMQFVFSNNPREVMSFESVNREDINYANAYYGMPLYMSSDNQDASMEVYTNMIQIAERIQMACLVDNKTGFNESETCDENLPIKDCTNNFIIIRETGNETDTFISQNQSCVFISAPKDEMLNATDAFLLKMLGISQ